MGDYTMIDLFSGAGGMSLGFRDAGFRSVLAVERDPAAAKTYELNFGSHVFQGSIEDVKDVPPVDLVIGGPPCQGFSALGKMSPAEAHKEMNQLWRQYLRIVEVAQPKAFVIENVPDILRSYEFGGICDVARSLGYELCFDVLKAVEHGVPQKRRRAIIIGLRREIGLPTLPTPSVERATVRDAIQDLPLQPTGVDWHIGRNPTPKSLERYRCIPPGGNRFDLVASRPDLAPACWLRKKTGSTDVFGRLHWDQPALTIRTEFYKPEKGCYLHPAADRPITHREAARLQTFPDEFVFSGSKIQVARQIGNAVPPRLARAVALHVRSLLDGNEMINVNEVQQLELFASSAV